MNSGKWLFVVLLIITTLNYILYRSDIVVYDTKKNMYTDAVRAATEVAAYDLLEVRDVNFTYDGVKNDIRNTQINLDNLAVFRTTLTRLLDSKESTSLVGVSNINIPLVGFISYDHIVGVAYNDVYLMPKKYTAYMNYVGINADINNKTWVFTLGDRIFINDVEYLVNGNVLKNSVTLVDYDISSFLLDKAFTSLSEFSDYVIMTNINDYLNQYVGTSFNKTVDNTSQALDFTLGKSNFSSGKEEYSKTLSVIGGSGIFSVIDIYTGTDNNQKLYQRIASIGGSELTPID